MSDRSKSIGASEVSCLFGCSPWQSAYGLWLLKAGLIEEQASTERMRAGLYLERAIFDEWANRATDEPCEPYDRLSFNTETFFHESGFISATPDVVGVWRSEKAVGDVKTVTQQRRADWNNGTPEYYRLQLQQQMLVTGAKRAVLIAQFGFTELSHEWIEADPALQEEIVRRCCEFWKRVQGELPPPDPDGSDATTDALKRRRVDAKVIELPQELRGLELHYDQARWDMAAAKKRVAECTNKIRAAMGDANTGIWGDGTGWRIQTITRKESVVKASTYTKLSRIKAKDAEDFGDTADE